MLVLYTAVGGNAILLFYSIYKNVINKFMREYCHFIWAEYYCQFQSSGKNIRYGIVHEMLCNNVR